MVANLCQNKQNTQFDKTLCNNRHGRASDQSSLALFKSCRGKRERDCGGSGNTKKQVTLLRKLLLMKVQVFPNWDCAWLGFGDRRVIQVTAGAAVGVILFAPWCPLNERSHH